MNLKSLVFVKSTGSYIVSIINHGYLRFEISLARQVACRRGLFDRNNVYDYPGRANRVVVWGSGLIFPLSVNTDGLFCLRCTAPRIAPFVRTCSERAAATAARLCAFNDAANYYRLIEIKPTTTCLVTKKSIIIFCFYASILNSILKGLNVSINCFLLEHDQILLLLSSGYLFLLFLSL